MSHLDEQGRETLPLNDVPAWAWEEAYRRCHRQCVKSIDSAHADADGLASMDLTAKLSAIEALASHAIRIAIEPRDLSI